MSYWRNKVVLVTGGSSGFGRVIAETFAEAGAKVSIAGLEAEPLSRAAGELQSAGFDILGVQADITRQDDVDRLFAQTLDRFGRLDVLVNNAGRSMRGKLLDTTAEQFRDLMELNLIALVRCTRAAIPHLLRPARPRGKHRFAGRQIGGPLGRGLSGNQIRRGRLFAAIAFGTGVLGLACAVGLPGPDQTQEPPPLSVRRPGRPARNRPATRSGRKNLGFIAAKTRPGHPQRLSTSPVGIDRSHIGPTAFRHCPTLAKPWPIGSCSA